MTTGSRTDSPPRVISAAADTLPAIWVDGTRVPPGVPHVSALDRGLLLADGLFETMRLYDGRVFRLDRHLDRLERAAEVLQIVLPTGLRGWIDEAVRALPARDAALRLTVTRGAGGAGVLPPDAAVPATVIVAISALPDFPRWIHERGLSAHVASGRRNERAMTAGLKTIAYTESIAAMLEARRAGADEALFLDTEGHCAEASASNLFAVIGWRLVTPPLECGALPGITRATVLELASALGISAEERPLALDELLGAEEAFLTSSLRELAPLTRVGDRAIGAGVPGRHTLELTAAYAALVRRECHP